MGPIGDSAPPVRRRMAAVLAVLAMAAALLVGVNAAPASAATCNPYPDVTNANPHCANIAWLKDQHITKPADGHYHPKSSVTRGAMTAFLFRLTHPGKSSPACKPGIFPDVTKANVFCGYITWAKKNNIAAGYPDGTFGSDRPVTRGAMAAFLYRIINPGIGAHRCTGDDGPFDDVTTHDTFCGVITWMVDNGITYGVGDGTNYGTTQPVTRQAMASFLHRMPHITLVNQTRTLSGYRGHDHVRIAVKLIQVIEPMTGRAPADAGNHYAGMLVRVTNVGPGEYLDDAKGSVHGVDHRGARHSTVNIFFSDLGPSMDQMVDLEPGNSTTGWVAVEMSNARRLSAVEYWLSEKNPEVPDVYARWNL